MFDVNIQAIGLDVAAPDEEALEAGAPPLLNYVIVAGLGLPFQNPQDGQPLRVPAAQIRFLLPKDISLEFAEVVVDQAGNLPDVAPDSGIIIADDVRGAEKLAKQMEDISGVRKGN